VKDFLRLIDLFHQKQTTAHTNEYVHNQQLLLPLQFLSGGLEANVDFG
jgi:hypothetical protein